jgi:hypothetical protein
MKKLSLVSSSVILLMVLSGCGSKMVGIEEESFIMMPEPMIIPPMEVGNTERYKHNDENHFKDILSLAKSAKGNDEEGYRADFIKVVEKTMLLKELK